MAVTPERMAEGKKVFQALVDFFHSIKLNFAQEELEDRYMIKFNMSGDDLPMRFFFYVNCDKQLITVHSPIPAKFEADKRDLACKAICAINYRLTDGDFQIDIRDGDILYNMSTSYADGAYSNKVFEYLMGMSINIVDEFNDKFLMLAKGLLDMDTLLSSLDY